MTYSKTQSQKMILILCETTIQQHKLQVRQLLWFITF